MATPMETFSVIGMPVVWSGARRYSTRLSMSRRQDGGYLGGGSSETSGMGGRFDAVNTIIGVYSKTFDGVQGNRTAGGAQ